MPTESISIKQDIAGATVCASVWFPGANRLLTVEKKFEKGKYTPYSINEAFSNTRTYGPSYFEVRPVMTKTVKKRSFIEEAKELFGEQRYFTDREREIYDRVTKEDSTPIGINTFDLLRKFKNDSGIH